MKANLQIVSGPYFILEDTPHDDDDNDDDDDDDDNDEVMIIVMKILCQTLRLLYMLYCTIVPVIYVDLSSSQYTSHESFYH